MNILESYSFLLAAAASHYTYSKQVKQLALPGPSGESPKMVSDTNKGFTEQEFAFIQKSNLPLPAEVFLSTIKDSSAVDEILNKTGEMNKTSGHQKAHLSTTKAAKKKTKDKIAEYDEQIQTIQKYRKRIGVIEEGKKTLKVGKGIYTQQKRNAYKITPSSAYGNLTIDVPKLYGILILVTYQNKKIRKKYMTSKSILIHLIF